MERTFSWFESFRRLSRDYEILPSGNLTNHDIPDDDTNYVEQTQMINSKQFLNITAITIYRDSK